MIPFLDLGAAYRELKPEIDAAVSRGKRRRNPALLVSADGTRPCWVG